MPCQGCRDKSQEPAHPHDDPNLRPAAKSADVPCADCQGPSGLLVIGYCAASGRDVQLVKSAESAHRSGLSAVIVATGSERLPDTGLPVFRIGPRMNLQQGESAIGREAIRIAREMGVEWLVKVAGDTFHPAPGWGRALIDLGESKAADMVATEHHRAGIPNTQVWAARVAFADATYPRPQNPGLAAEGVEPTWAKRIAGLGLAELWYVPPAVRLAEDEWVNFSPADAGIAYLHTHRAGEAALWSAAGGSTPAPDAALAVDIVIPARDEDQQDAFGRMAFPETLKSIADTSAGFRMPNVIVVDDGSERPFPMTQPAGLPLRVLRNPQPLGVDPARNTGAGAGRGDVIGIMDGHMRVETQEGVKCMGGLQRLAALAAEKNAIVVGRCADINHTGKKKDDDYPMCAGSFVRITLPNHGCGIYWNHFVPPAGIRRVNAMMGASYFFPRPIWERLGGFVDCCRCFGFSEEGMALKAAFLDIPIWYCGDVTVSHLFRATSAPYVVDGFEKWMNQCRVLHVAFEADTFREFWLPRMKLIRDWNWNPRHDQALRDEALLKEGLRFKAKKVKTDKEVLAEHFGVTL